MFDFLWWLIITIIKIVATGLCLLGLISYMLESKDRSILTFIIWSVITLIYLLFGFGFIFGLSGTALIMITIVFLAIVMLLFWAVDPASYESISGNNSESPSNTNSSKVNDYSDRDLFIKKIPLIVHIIRRLL
ncbi:hypothetical protein [Clostridium estertheticum]|uniref:hypothetical protein n=1 Tax=Clostridium estertheticum TaxID=238834 RepID=UPI001C7D4C3C|nr:hypothetical protein [Clostridium estertheticum]MBX4263075.1 hypothetical protein [Clostridium estertheticum]MBX4271145.1 hypothetical protein [Clostridium estertheticum]WLC78379.1 hypothetical protein KTC98_14190 [Clostridium estertheticum]WLC89396.1 hypothetical protein KTC95_03985 [Clostridium estertheticum]